MFSNEDWLRKCYLLAKNSPDRSTQNGALVLDEHGSLSGVGWNTFTDGFIPGPEHFERPLKYLYTEHAERNAIFSATSLGSRPVTMFCAWAACADCARAIVQSGIKTLVRHVREDDEGRWNESIEHGDIILRAGGVEIVDVKERLGCQPVLFNGKMVLP